MTTLVARRGYRLGGKFSLPRRTISNSKIKHKVYLREEQRQQLKDISRNGFAPAQQIWHARVLLMTDQDHSAGRWTDTQINQALGVDVNTLAKMRQRIVSAGEASGVNRGQQELPLVPASETRCGKASPSSRHLWHRPTSRTYKVDAQLTGQCSIVTDGDSEAVASFPASGATLNIAEIQLCVTPAMPRPAHPGCYNFNHSTASFAGAAPCFPLSIHVMLFSRRCTSKIASLLPTVFT